MPNQPAPCGLRTRHDPHPFGELDSEWCDGKQPPDHYDARHRGRYQPETGWWGEVTTPSWWPVFFRCKHRKSGEPVIADEPHHPHSRPRLGWADRSDDAEGADAG